MSIYITVGSSKKKYYPQYWQFTAYQFLNIHTEDESGVTPYCRTENQANIPLIENRRSRAGHRIWRLPYQNDREHENNIKPTVGKITIDYADKTYKLNILPSVLNLNEFKAMALHIARLMFKYQSFTFFNEALPINKAKTDNKGQRIGANTYQKSQDEILLDNIINRLYRFFSVLEKNIDIIIKNPASVMRAEKQVINIKKSHKPQDLLKRKLQSHKKVTMAYSKVYDDCSDENKWLAYVVYQALERLLENQEQLLLDIQQQQRFDNQLQSNSQKNQQKQQLEDLKIRLRHIQQIPFLQKFKPFANKQPTITTKLKKSKGYSAIFKEFQNIFNSEVVKSFNQYQDIQQAFASGYIDNLSNIYECWCLFVIYDNLLKLGFSVQSKGLEDCLQLKNNNLILPAETVITLEKPFAQYDNKVANDKKKIIVTLAYEPKLARKDRNEHDYTPDIKMDFIIPERALGLQTFSIILDAKFKNYIYNNNGYKWNYLNELEKTQKFLKECILIQDIMGTAIYKYYDALVEKPNMSVILHPNHSVLWSGEKPLQNFFKEKEFLTDEGWTSLENKLGNHDSDIYSHYRMKQYINESIAHKFGLLVLRPESLAKDIRRLFTLIFHYHIGVTSLCLCCGRELHQSDEFYVNTLSTNEQSFYSVTKDSVNSNIKWSNSDPNTKFRAVCSNCQTQWRISFCATCGKPKYNNRIVKVGKNDRSNDDEVGYFSLHYRDENKNTACPRCGNVFKSSTTSELCNHPNDN